MADHAAIVTRNHREVPADIPGDHLVLAARRQFVGYGSLYDSEAHWRDFVELPGVGTDKCSPNALE